MLKIINIKLPPKAIDYFGFLILKAKLAFSQLKYVFIEVFLIYYFDLKRYNWIKIDISAYVIDGNLSQQTPKFV